MANNKDRGDVSPDVNSNDNLLLEYDQLTRELLAHVNIEEGIVSFNGVSLDDTPEDLDCINLHPM